MNLKFQISNLKSEFPASAFPQHALAETHDAHQETSARPFQAGLAMPGRLTPPADSRGSLPDPRVVNPDKNGRGPHSAAVPPAPSRETGQDQFPKRFLVRLTDGYAIYFWNRGYTLVPDQEASIFPDHQMAEEMAHTKGLRQGQYEIEGL